MFLITVSPDGRWAVVIARSVAGSGARVEFRSLRGEKPLIVCDEACRDIGPASVRYGMPFQWSPNGTQLLVN